MGKIRIMPEWLRNQIAAGEVIERPASVVKELVENSLDAGATEVFVQFEKGGKKLIRVVDNGCGMNEEDAQLALERHATSKLYTFEDLKKISTLGFRGEALPSIASVSKFTLRTQTPDSQSGIEVRCTGCHDRFVSEISMRPGCEVIVQDLFFNVPARRKFLKKDNTESEQIINVVQRIAMVRPDVRFVVIRDGRKILDLPIEKDWLARVVAILGKKYLDDLYECSFEGTVSVSGFVSKPDVKKRNASMVFTYVNGRFVKDKIITQALLAAYGNLLQRGEYPIAVLKVELPYELVDVNVHPTKHEVRFQQPSEVYSAVNLAVKRVLDEAPWLFPETESKRKSQPYLTTKSTFSAPSVQTSSSVFQRRLEVPVYTLQQKTKSKFSQLRYVGQVGLTYLICESEKGIYFIDQHAAHEKVLYERLRSDLQAGGVKRQALLVPEALQTTPAQIAAVETHKATLQKLGFVIEPMGNNIVVVRSVPTMLVNKGITEAVLELIEQLEEQKSPDTPFLEKILASIACKSAVKAGDRLSEEEAKKLLEQMDIEELTTFCPHGRPSVIIIPFSEVEKWFKRG